MDLESRREISHHLFGNKFALEVGAAIATYEKERFTQQDIALVTGIDKSCVRTAFVRLHRGQLIEEAGPERPKNPYKRVESTMWEAYIALRTELE